LEHPKKILTPEIMENLNKNRDNLKNLVSNMFQELSKIGPANICYNSGAMILEENKIGLDFFDRQVVVDLENKNVFYSENGRGRIKREGTEFLDIFSISLILHYLVTADGTPVAGKWISYRELPGGLFYWSAIPPVIAPLIEKYQKNGRAFLDRVLRIGGSTTQDFKHGAVLRPFTRFPVLMIIDEEDEEFGANLRLLFDESSPHYIKTDVIKILMVYIVKLLL
jgi:hypothetical protein